MWQLHSLYILAIILLVIAAFQGLPEKLLRKVAKDRRDRINELKHQLKKILDNNCQLIDEIMDLRENYSLLYDTDQQLLNQALEAYEKGLNDGKQERQNQLDEAFRTGLSDVSEKFETAAANMEELAEDYKKALLN